MNYIEQQLNNLATYCGLKMPGERGVDPKLKGEEEFERDTKVASMLSDLLLYEFCDDESGVFFNKGSIGCWFEINPIVGSNDSIEKNLTLFFADELPEGGYLQFLIVASNDVSQILNMWEEGRSFGGEPIKQLTKYRRHFIEDLANNYKDYNDGRLARDYRSYVTYSIKDNGKKSVKELLAFQKKLENKLRTENLQPRTCIAKDLMRIGRDLLQMNYSKDRVKYDPLNNLADQVVDRLVSNTIEPDGIVHNDTGMVSKVFAPKELPESFSLSEMVNLLGDESKTIAGRFVISYVVANNLGVNGTSAINTAGDRVIHASGRSYTRHDLTVQEEARQWVDVKAIHKKGEVYLQESMLIMLSAPKEEIEIAESVLSSLYNSYDWKIEVCNYVQRIGSLAMLPMMQYSYWQSLKFFKLTRYALSGEVVAKLPLQGEWKGVPASGALLIGRRGQLFNFNPYYRIGGGGNYNIAIMAPSGAGKSFLLQELAQSMMAQDVAVFVLDIGASYKNICRLLEGEMIRFNHSCDISLNPFAALSNSGARYIKALKLLSSGLPLKEIMSITGLTEEKIQGLEQGIGQSGENEGIELIEIKSKLGSGSEHETHFVTKDSIIYAKSLIAAMCNMSAQSRAEALIERAIIEGISIHGDRLDITKMMHVLASLKDKDGRFVDGASAMADSLYPYTEEGIHGRFFANNNEATFKKMLTVFELEELQNDKPLLSVVLQIILMQITMQFLCGDRSRRFMLIVDEAWMILDFAANFLERFARTVRKYGGSLVVCTQDLTSFSNVCGTKKANAAVLESSTWKLILQQNADGMKTFNAHEGYKKYSSLIQSLRKCPNNKFSEVLIHTDGATVVGRLATEGYSTALFSTENSDFNYLLRAEKEGLSIHESILELSKKYGGCSDGSRQNVKSNQGKKAA